MTLFVVAELRAMGGQEDRLRTALEAMVEPSLDEPGCLAYRPYADPNDPSRMVVVEEWTGPAALGAHFATPHFRHAEMVFDRILAEPMTVRRLGAVTP
ncbi:antibiotic biosynthesis monooxygenase [Actinomadura logoneensis]|uniref:Antibiotic biosynthesis monooxygenase n=1 Tax=Actinomadura logoneensis TaxID=2293572 RepID=A0A372JNU9_9ACTN|nr:putative quinol monooxygenase [Actinomadura logoneensis]RFU41476.1 antibiotic biosynthesis monooxygenase [Actinomadura logoneensis]